ncbi:unnamed protein product [Cylicostephanus goldi]|uniref:Major facilitator superfamily (MFS) profile domain-containing protein n=1 Tax=Cylicostephanus goldi TaxID=71465 RepID=A0A3P6T863_CYLGO|nr:unnamed protein product [Cylicostephanus goldi]
MSTVGHTQQVGDVDTAAKLEKVKTMNIGRVIAVYCSTPWRSVYVAALCSFVQAIQYGLFFSSLWPYLKSLDPTVSETFFGYIVAIYSLGQCIASPVFGYWSNRIKQVRAPTIFGFNMMLFGNLIYLFMDFLPHGYGYTMAISRALVGIGSMSE